MKRKHIIALCALTAAAVLGAGSRDGGVPDAPDGGNRQHVRGRSAGGGIDRAGVGQAAG